MKRKDLGASGIYSANIECLLYTRRCEHRGPNPCRWLSRRQWRNKQSQKYCKLVSLAVWQRLWLPWRSQGEEPYLAWVGRGRPPSDTACGFGFMEAPVGAVPSLSFLNWKTQETNVPGSDHWAPAQRPAAQSKHQHPP